MIAGIHAQTAPRSPGAGSRAPGPGAGAMHGFTIAEAMIVVAILAVLAGLAVPSLNQFVLGQRVKNASFDLFSSLVLARSEAITRNAAVTVTPAGGGWQAGWTVTAADGTVIRRQDDAYSTIAIAGPANVGYNGTGRLSAAVGAFSVTATGATPRCITIDPSGRPVSKTVAC